ncbi:MAG: LuxR C-terminal-related transcriptional regulator, partial [Dehalococcoidia bacterium]
FSHALIQQTLAEEVTTSRRVRLHARIGEALEAMYGDDAEAHAAELAHHFAEAEAVLGPTKFVHYSVLAGEKALASYAWEEAQNHFEKGLAARSIALAGSEPLPDAEAAALLFGLARAQMNMVERHEMLQSADSLSLAFNYYADAGDVERAVAVAEYPYPPSWGQSLTVTKLIPRALGLVPAESHQAGRLLSRYGYLMGMEEGDSVGAQEAFARALSIAEREHDTILEMVTLANAARIDRSRHDYNEALRKGLRAIELARQHDHLFVEVTARYDAAGVLRETGELEQARQHAVAMLEGADQLRDRAWRSSALNLSGTLCYLMGDWPAARGFSDLGLAVSPGDHRNLSNRAVGEYQVGEFDQGSVHLERLLEVMRLTPSGPHFPNAFPALVIPLIARITGLANRLELAEEAAQTVLSSPSVTPGVGQLARAGLGLNAVLKGDRAASEEQYAALKSRRGTMLPRGMICCDRLLGLLAQAMGNLDKAPEHFEDALAFCRKAGYKPELAWTCCDYSDTLLQRNGSGDRAKAISLLDESLSISTELGMLPLMKRVTERLESAQSRPAVAPIYPDGLTQREVEVLRLLSAGKTDREIAEELFVSVRTVGGHVSNILNKTNSANRTEAAAYAALHGLISH